MVNRRRLGVGVEGTVAAFEITPVFGDDLVADWFCSVWYFCYSASARDGLGGLGPSSCWNCGMVMAHLFRSRPCLIDENRADLRQGWSAVAGVVVSRFLVRSAFVSGVWLQALAGRLTK